MRRRRVERAAAAATATALIVTAVALSATRMTYQAPAVVYYESRAISRREVAFPDSVRVWTIAYRANGGRRRLAYVVLPRAWSSRYHPPLPLVISPHGRGVDPLVNAALFGDMPARGPFALICPEGQGRRLTLFSWGWRGQIRDLARMPQIARSGLPWLSLEPHRVYAFGGSMGGQEILLLLALYPRLLAGAAAFDAVTDFARRYYEFPQSDGSNGMQRLARLEVPDTPRTDPAGYRMRSPITYVRRVASSDVPLELWWSMTDEMVIDQLHQSALFYDRIEQLDPGAPVTTRIGFWRHSAEMTATSLLPLALEAYGLSGSASRASPPTTTDGGDTTSTSRTP